MQDPNIDALLREATRILRDEDFAPEERDQRVDDLLAELLRARYASSQADLSEQAKVVALEALLEAARIRQEAETLPSRNGFLRGYRLWIAGQQGSRVPRKRMLAFATAAVVVVAAIFVLWSSRRGSKDMLANVPAPHNQNSPHKPRQPERRVAPELPNQDTKLAQGAKPPLRRKQVARDSSHGPGPEISVQGGLAAIPHRNEVGKLTEVIGQPHCTFQGESVARAARRGSAVYPGSTIETGDADQATLRLADGTTLQLGFNTSLEIPTAKPVSARQARLDRTGKGGVSAGPVHVAAIKMGTVSAKVAPQSPSNPFVIRTPAAAAKVLGTEFSLKVRRRFGGTSQGAAPIETALSVKNGRVEFYNEHGHVECTGMTESAARIDAAPTTPKRIRYIRSSREAGVIHSSRPVLSEFAARLVWDPGYTGLILHDQFAPENPHPWESPIGGGKVETVVRVLEVDPNSPAQRAGIQPGDIVRQIAGGSVATADMAGLAIRRNSPGALSITFSRGAAVRTVVLRTTVDAESPAPRLTGRERRIVNAATQLMLNGDLPRAGAALADAVQRTGGAAALNNQGILFNYDGKFAEAIRALSKAVRLRPRVSLYRTNLAIALSDFGNSERAAEEFEIAIKLAPRWVVPYIRLTDEYADRLVRIGDALSVTDRWLRVYPNEELAWARRAKVLRVAGRYGEALRAAERAMAEGPNSAWGFSEAAWIHRYDGDNARSESLYLKSLELTARQPHFLSGLATALADQGRLEQAAAATLIAIQLEPEDFVLHANLAQFYRLMGKLDLAEKSARLSIRMEPKFAPAYDALSQVLIAANNLTEAELVAHKAVELGQDKPTSLNVLGLVLNSMNRLPEAERCLRDALAIDPDFPPGNSNLGAILGKIGKFAEGESYVRRALKLQPKSADFHFDLSAVLYGAQRFAEAEESAREALKLKPRNSLYLRSIAMSLAAQQKPSEAETFFLKAIELNPPDEQNYYTLAGMYERLGRLNDAESTFRKAVDHAGERSMPLTQLAFFLSRHSRLDEALAVAEDSVKVASIPRLRGQALGTLGVVRVRRNELDQAEKALREAIAIDSYASSLRWKNLGYVLEKTGRSEEALTAYRRALEITPNDREAQEGVKRVESAESNDPN